MQCSFSKASIVGVASCLPKKKVALKDQAEKLFKGDYTRISMIQKSLGWEERYVVDRDTTSLDLCYLASNHLLNYLKIDRNTIDGIISVTQTPNLSLPGNAHLLHQKLGLNSSCFAIDVLQGCTGFIYGLYLSFMMIETGANNILLCAGDTLSKVVDQTNPNLAPFFGDGGSATLITKNNSKSYFCLHSDGKGWEHLFSPKEDNNTNHGTLFMNGTQLFNESLKCESTALEELLKIAKIKVEDIKLSIFHQGNAYTINRIAKKIGLKCAPTYPTNKYANTSSASIPISLCDIATTFPNSLITNQSILFSAFGAGFSWANCFLEDSSFIGLDPIFKE